MTLMKNALEKQTGGNHYKERSMQPWDVIDANGLSLLEGNIVKYVSRWKKKGGLTDLQKIIHCAELIIEIHNVKEDK